MATADHDGRDLDAPLSQAGSALPATHESLHMGSERTVQAPDHEGLQYFEHSRVLPEAVSMYPDKSVQDQPELVMAYGTSDPRLVAGLAPVGEPPWRAEGG